MKIRRPYGTRFYFLLYPALEAPGYCQTPLRGWFLFLAATHRLRGGLYSCAASRLCSFAAAHGGVL